MNNVDPKTGLQQEKNKPVNPLAKKKKTSVQERLEAARRMSPTQGSQTRPVRGTFGEYSSDLNVTRSKNFNELRAQNQEFLELTGKGIVQGIGTFAGMMVEGVGNLVDVPESIGRIARGQAPSFERNLISETGKSIQEWTRELAPIYQTELAQSNSLKRFADYSFITANAPTIASAAAIMIPSMGVAFGASTVARVLGASKMGQQVVAGMAGAISGREIEAEMESQQLYEDQMEVLQKEGMTKEEAHQQASKEALSMYNSSWSNLAMDVPAWFIGLRGTNLANRSLKKSIVDMAETSDEPLLKAVRNHLLKDPSLTTKELAGKVGFKSWADFALQAGLEGVEEMNVEVQKRRILRNSRILSGEETGDVRNLLDIYTSGDFTQFFDDPEVLNATVFGAIGGAIFGGLQRGFAQYNNKKDLEFDALQADNLNQQAQHTKQRLDKITAALKEGDEIGANEEMKLMVSDLAVKGIATEEGLLPSAASLGNLDNLQEMYRGVASLTDAEMQELGFDPQIREQAESAVQELDKIKEIYGRNSKKSHGTSIDNVINLYLSEQEYMNQATEESVSAYDSKIAEFYNDPSVQSALETLNPAQQEFIAKQRELNTLKKERKQRQDSLLTDSVGKGTHIKLSAKVKERSLEKLNERIGQLEQDLKDAQGAEGLTKEDISQANDVQKDIDKTADLEMWEQNKLIKELQLEEGKQMLAELNKSENQLEIAKAIQSNKEEIQRKVTNFLIDRSFEDGEYARLDDKFYRFEKVDDDTFQVYEVDEEFNVIGDPRTIKDPEDFLNRATPFSPEYVLTKEQLESSKKKIDKAVKEGNFPEAIYEINDYLYKSNFRGQAEELRQGIIQDIIKAIENKNTIAGLKQFANDIAGSLSNQQVKDALGKAIREKISIIRESNQKQLDIFKEMFAEKNEEASAILDQLEATETEIDTIQEDVRQLEQRLRDTAEKKNRTQKDILRTHWALRRDLNNAREDIADRLSNLKALRRKLKRQIREINKDLDVYQKLKGKIKEASDVGPYFVTQDEFNELNSFYERVKAETLVDFNLTDYGLNKLRTAFVDAREGVASAVSVLENYKTAVLNLINANDIAENAANRAFDQLKQEVEIESDETLLLDSMLERFNKLYNRYLTEEIADGVRDIEDPSNITALRTLSNKFRLTDQINIAEFVNNELGAFKQDLEPIMEKLERAQVAIPIYENIMKTMLSKFEQKDPETNTRTTHTGTVDFNNPKRLPENVFNRLAGNQGNYNDGLTPDESQRRYGRFVNYTNLNDNASDYQIEFALPEKVGVDVGELSDFYDKEDVILGVVQTADGKYVKEDGSTTTDFDPSVNVYTTVPMASYQSDKMPKTFVVNDDGSYNISESEVKRLFPSDSYKVGAEKYKKFLEQQRKDFQQFRDFVKEQLEKGETVVRQLTGKSNGVPNEIPENQRSGEPRKLADYFGKEGFLSDKPTLKLKVMTKPTDTFGGQRYTAQQGSVLLYDKSTGNFTQAYRRGLRSEEIDTIMEALTYMVENSTENKQGFNTKVPMPDITRENGDSVYFKDILKQYVYSLTKDASIRFSDDKKTPGGKMIIETTEQTEDGKTNVVTKTVDIFAERKGTKIKKVNPALKSALKSKLEESVIQVDSAPLGKQEPFNRFIFKDGKFTTQNYDSYTAYVLDNNVAGTWLKDVDSVSVVQEGVKVKEKGLTHFNQNIYYDNSIEPSQEITEEPPATQNLIDLVKELQTEDTSLIINVPGGKAIYKIDFNNGYTVEAGLIEDLDSEEAEEGAKKSREFIKEALNNQDYDFLLDMELHFSSPLQFTKKEEQPVEEESSSVDNVQEELNKEREKFKNRKSGKQIPTDSPDDINLADELGFQLSSRAVELSENQVNKLSRELSDRTGIPINVMDTQRALYHLDYLRDQGIIDESFTEDTLPKGLYLNGVAYVFGDNFTADTPFHEVSHPIINQIIEDNPALFESLKQQVIDSPQGQALRNRIVKNYPNALVDGELTTSAWAEILTTAIGETAANKYYGKANNSIIRAVKQLWEEIKRYLKQFVGQDVVELDNLSADTTIGDIADLLTNASKTFNLTTSQVTQYQDNLSPGERRKIDVAFNLEYKKERRELSRLIGDLIFADVAFREANTPDLQAERANARDKALDKVKNQVRSINKEFGIDIDVSLLDDYSNQIDIRIGDLQTESAMDSVQKQNELSSELLNIVLPQEDIIDTSISRYMSFPQYQRVGNTWEGKDSVFTKQTMDAFNFYFFANLFQRKSEKLPDLFSTSGVSSDFYNELITDVNTAFTGARDTIEAKLEEAFEKENLPLVKKLNELHDNYTYVLDNFKQVVDMHREYLQQYNIEAITDETFILENEKDANDLWATEGLKFSAKQNATSNIRLLVGSLRKRQDATNKAFSVPENVHFGDVFNLLANTLSNSRDLATMKQKIEKIKTKEGMQSLLDRLLNKTEVIDQLSYSDVQTLLEFRKTFGKHYNDYSIMFTGPNGYFKDIDANADTTQRRLIDQWKSNIDPDNPNFTEKKGQLVYDIESMKERGILASESLVDNPLFDQDKSLPAVERNYRRSVAFLSELGINIITDTLAGDEFNNAAQQIYLALRNGEEANVLSRFSNQKKNINEIIAPHEVNNSNNIIENSHVRRGGEKVYNVNLYSYLTLSTDKINESTSLEELEQSMPHLFSTYNQSSILLNRSRTSDKRHTFLFDSEGKRKTSNKLKVSFKDEFARDNSNDFDVFAKLSKTDQTLITLNSALNGSYALFRAGDNSIERHIEMFEFFQASEIEKGEHYGLLKDYLKDELATIIEYLNSDTPYDTIAGKTTKDLLSNFPVANILMSNTGLKKALVDAVESGDTSDFFTGKNNQLTNRAFDSYFETAIDETKEYLLDNRIISKKSEKEYNNHGLLHLTTDTSDTLKESNLQKILSKALVNRFVANIEQTKIITGPPVFFGNADNLYKRMSGVVGTKESSAVADLENQIIESKFPRKNSKRLYKSVETGGQLTEEYTEWKAGAKPIVRTSVFEDVKVQSSYLNKLKKLGLDTSEYESMDEADAVGYVSIDGWRDMLIRSSQWTQELERLYQWETREDGADQIDVINWVTGQAETLTEADIKNTDGSRTVATMIKPQYFGPLAENGFIPGMYKTALLPILPSYASEFPSMRQLMDYQNNFNIDIVTFPSANKVGTKVNEEGNSPNLYENEEGNAQLNFADGEIQDTFYEYWGIQLDTGHKVKRKVVKGTQMMKMIFSNIYENGEATNKKLQPQAELLTSVNNELIERGIEELKDELNLVQDKDGNYSPESVDNLISFLERESRSRDVNNNVLDSLSILREKWNDTNLKLDIMSNRDKIENILASIADSRVISQKMPGGSKVQAPVTLFEKGVRRYANKQAHLRSQELAFYEDGTMEVYLPHYFKEVVGDLSTDQIEESLLKGIGFRIPTSGLNSIEHIKIKGFLPQSAGETIVVPSEIVAKAGSDFDVDKLNVYLPNYRMKNGKPEYIKFLDRQDFNSSRTFAEAVYEQNYGQLIRQKEYLANKYNKTIESDSDINELFDAIMGQSFEDMDFIADESLRKRLTSIPTQQEFYESIQDKGPLQYNSREALENKMIELMGTILSDESNQAQLLESIGTDMIEEQEKNIIKKLDLTTDRKSMTDVIGNFPYAMEVLRRNIESKQLTGIAALHSTDHMHAMRYGYAMNKTHKIKLPHNETENGLINLGAQTTVAGEKITSILNQLVNTAVDGAKKPIFYNLNMNLDTANVVFYLLRSGVSLKDTFEFVNTPIIREYVKLTRARQAVTDVALTAQEVKQMVRKKYPSQKNKLSDYLEYEKSANVLNNYIQGTRIDTQGMGKNTTQLDFIKRNADSIARGDSGIVNADKLLTQGFMSKHYDALTAFDEMFTPFFITKNDPNADVAYQVLIDYYSPKKMETEAKIAVLDKFKADYLTHVVLRNPFTIKGTQMEPIHGQTNLVIGKNTVAKRLRRFKETGVDNLFIQGLQPVIGTQKFDINGKKQFVDTVKLYNQRMDTIEFNSYIDGFRELFDEDYDLAVDLVKLAFMQGGLQLTPMSFTNLIPAEIYTEVIDTAFKNHPGTDPSAFLRKFFLSNYHDPNIVPTKYGSNTPDSWIYKTYPELNLTKQEKERRKELNQPITEPVPRIFVNLNKDAEALGLFQELKNNTSYNIVSISTNAIRENKENVNLLYYGDYYFLNEFKNGKFVAEQKEDQTLEERPEKTISRMDAIENKKGCE